MFGGFYVAQALMTPEEDKKISLLGLQGSLTALERGLASLLELENQYHKSFEALEISEKKSSSQFKLFPGADEPLLPDLGLKEKIKLAAAELEKLHREFVELAQTEKKHIGAEPKYKELLNRYHAIAYHFHEENDNDHVAAPGK